MSQRKTVIVYDPIGDKWGDGVLVANDEKQLQSLMLAHKEAFVFLDECGELFREGVRRDINWLGTRSRHLGHNVVFIAQRYTQVPTTVRFQCSRLYLFNTSLNDSTLAAEEWNHPELVNAPNLPRMHFYCVSRFDPVAYYRIEGYKHAVRVGSTGNANGFVRDSGGGNRSIGTSNRTSVSRVKKEGRDNRNGGNGKRCEDIGNESGNSTNAVANGNGGTQ